MEFLGRLDSQVKIRGFRVELGEIEAVLARHPRVRGSVAVVREDRPGDRRLVAYVVPTDAGLSSQELRQFVGERVPEYLLPPRSS
jgi:acyl-coenzyme A synthetase/AMP-(fatty) acid ligase